VSKSAFLSLSVLISLGAISAAVFLAVFATSAQTKRTQQAGNSRSPRGVVQEEWVARYNGGHGFDLASAIAVDGSGNIYLTGSSVGPGSCNLDCNDYATIKYNASGMQEWVARCNGPGNGDDEAYGIGVDAS